MPILLLADDNITVQRVIGLTFATEDFEVVTVSDGQAAIDRIKSQPPDIVLAGASMPNISGYDVARFVRSHPGLSGLPVLLLSGAFETVDPVRLHVSGASGVLEKPLDPTTVINRVKELLGLRGDIRPTPTPGRLVTPAKAPADKKQPVPREAPASSQARHTEPPPVRASQASSWDELRESSGLASDARSVEGGNESRAEDYLDTLDAAFDSLDQRLAGRGDDRSRQAQGQQPPPRHDRDRRPAAPAAQDALAGSGIYEVDDAWFVEDATDREKGLAEQKVLASEMGLRDMQMPGESGAADAADPNDNLDSEVGPGGEPKPAPAASQGPAPVSPMPAAAAPMPPQSGPPPARDVADDFAALLAFEQGEQPQPPAQSEPEPAPVVVYAAPPEITDAMLEQIATRVAERLNTGLLNAMTATIRDTVRAVVSETSERLVRDEIARIKGDAERDTT